jgi:hypothetical protein
VSMKSEIRREDVLAEVADEFTCLGRLFFPPDLSESPADEEAFWSAALKKLAERGLATDWELRALQGRDSPGSC